MLARSTGVTMVLVSAAGCGAASSAADSAGAEDAVVTSASGMLQVEARTLDGEAPLRGVNAFDIEIARADSGEPLADAQVTLTPWMPAMGHGTSVKPAMTAVGEGHYHAQQVYLFMPGLWELRISIAGSVQDDAALRFQIR